MSRSPARVGLRRRRLATPRGRRAVGARSGMPSVTGGRWVGPAVRLQSGGQSGYLGIYFWNSGSPVLRLYKRTAGNWAQIGSGYSSGALAAGTQLQVTAIGSKISFLVNGVQRITVT